MVKHIFRDKLNVKEAIYFIAEAWNNVTETTIQNCWIKTGILPNSNDIIMVNVNIQGSELDDNENNIIILPDADDVNEYFDSFDQNVPTQEHLNDEEIISLVQFEEMGENGDDSSSDEEIPLIPVKNTINGLETFINFFEQQKNNEKFKIDDLHIFRKYLGIVKLMGPKIQKSIYAYFEKKEC
nr:13587_t:CDS:1 [Entrophospora candida]